MNKRVYTIAAVFLITATSSFSQVLNDDLINYSVSVKALKHDIIHIHNEDGREEPVFHLGVNPLIIYSQDTFMNCECDDKIPPGVNFRWGDRTHDTSTPFGVAKEVDRENFVKANYLNLGIRFWESDDENDPGYDDLFASYYHCFDDILHHRYKILNLKPGLDMTAEYVSPAKIDTLWVYAYPEEENPFSEDSTYDYIGVEYHIIWRYSNGADKDQALDFGRIDTTMLFHTNSNRSYSIADFGYEDSIVYYKFYVPENGRKVNIKLSGTNFEAHLRLMDDVDKLLDEGDSIIYELCEGNYYIEVSGKDGATGDFTLSVDPDPIKIEPGMPLLGTEVWCEGDPIGTVDYLTQATAGSLNSLDITYKWYRSENGADFLEIFGATEVDLAESYTGNIPAVSEDQDFVQFYRVAYACEANATIEDTLTITATESIINPGSIELVVDSTTNETYDSSYTMPAGVDPGYFKSKTDATGSPDSITYRWEQRITEQGTWRDLNAETVKWDPTSATFENGGRYQIRRIAINGCGEEASSNIISIDAIASDGAITGTVTSKPGPGGLGAGVPGVVVTAVRTTKVTGGNLTDSIYQDTTDINGEYLISNIYYGPGNGADFTITPSKIQDSLEHEFSPASRNRALSSNFKVATNVDFVDVTTFTFAGQVYQNFENTPCGLDSVIIWLNNTVVDTTDESGNYSISIPNIGTHTIEARYKNHSMDTLYEDLYIDRDYYDQNFMSLDRYRVAGLLTDGCNNPIGEATITFSDPTNCISTSITTGTNYAGYYEVELPARHYMVQLTDHDDLEVNAFFAKSRKLDLTEADDTVFHFRYRAIPVIEVEGMPDPISCSAPYNVPVLEQAIEYPITIYVYEGEDKNCLVDEGSIIVYDEIRDHENSVNSDTIPFKGGVIDYIIYPGIPNFIGDHLKGMTITGIDALDRISTPFTQKVMVNGAEPREQTFTTVTPELPFMILRDPPGDASYSFIEENESFEMASRLYNLEDSKTNLWGAVKIGVEFTTTFDAGFIKIGFPSKSWGKFSSSIEVGSRSTSSIESIDFVNYSERFSTSDNPDVIGTEGDIFVGGAMNMLYAVADELTLNENTCEVETGVDLVMANTGFATEYIYTEQYIRETVIPQLVFLAENTLDPDSSAFYRDQIHVWQQTLQENERLKKSATFIENKSFSNNAPYHNTTTSQTSKTSTIKFIAEINEEVAVETGFEIAGNGVSGGVKASFKKEFGFSETVDTTRSLTTGYHLEDNDIGDGFTVDIYSDPVYKTPVFELISGVSSCPWEPGTQPRDEPKLSALNPIATGIAVNDVAEFTLRLGNTSQSMEERTYYLKLNPESNPYGANVRINGSPYINPIEYTIGYNDFIDASVEIGMGKDSVFSYALEFELYVDCDPGISEKVSLTAFFESKCSDVALFAPIDGDYINAYDPVFEVHIKDYSKSALDQIQIEYSPVGENKWRSLKVVPAADLEENENLGTIVDLNMSHIEDGEYHLRLKVVFGELVNFSSTTRIIIDTEAPQIMGNPNPSDDIYEEGDELSVTFNEWIDCSEATATLNRSDTPDDSTLLNMDCYENLLLLIPPDSLNGAYRVVVRGVKDIYGNIADPVSWTFSSSGTTSTTELDPLFKDIVLYPNPAKQQFTLEFNLLRKMRTVVGIFNLQGQLVNMHLDENLVPGNWKSTIDVGNLDAGFYLVVVAGGSEKTVMKLIVVK